MISSDVLPPLQNIVRSHTWSLVITRFLYFLFFAYHEASSFAFSPRLRSSLKYSMAIEGFHNWVSSSKTSIQRDEKNYQTKKIEYYLYLVLKLLSIDILCY